MAQRRDVTARPATTRSTTAWSRVTPSGFVTAVGKGQGAVMVRFEGQAAISLFVIPYAEQVQLAGWKNNNFIDELAATKFRELGIEPSPAVRRCDVRPPRLSRRDRHLPTVEETRAFLASDDADKRIKLVDRLLGLSSDAVAEYLQRRVCRLVGAQVVGPAAQQQQRPGRAGHVGHAQLDSPVAADQ